MEKSSKKSIIFIVVIMFVVAVLAYYLLVFSPAQKETNKQVNLYNKIKCSEAGKEYALKNVDETIPYGSIYKEPQYAFSKELNTCLYRKEFSTYWGEGILLATDYSIIDIYSNQIVASIFKHYNANGEPNNTIGDEDEYLYLVGKYFNSDAIPKN